MSRFTRPLAWIKWCSYLSAGAFGWNAPDHVECKRRYVAGEVSRAKLVARSVRPPLQRHVGSSQAITRMDELTCEDIAA